MRKKNLGDLLGDIETQVASHRSEGWKVVKYKELPLIVVHKQDVKSGITRYLLKGWWNKARIPIKSLSKYYYRTPEAREEVVRRFVKMREDWVQRKKEEKTVKASDFWSVGDVVVYSWGYDQTNIDFYQVTKVLGKMIEIREIAQNSSDRGGPEGGNCAPRRYEFIGEPTRKRVNPSGYVAFNCGIGTKWNGRACGCSSYH